MPLVVPLSITNVLPFSHNDCFCCTALPCQKSRIEFYYLSHCTALVDLLLQLGSTDIFTLYCRSDYYIVKGQYIKCVLFFCVNCSGEYVVLTIYCTAVLNITLKRAVHRTCTVCLSRLWQPRLCCTALLS